MLQYILYNDRFHTSNSAVLNAGNRAFKYGDAFFETMRMIKGKLQFADLHAERIKHSMRALKMDGYNLLDEYFLKQKTTELKARNKLGQNVRFRLTIFREGDGFYTPSTNKVGYILEAQALDSAFYDWDNRGLLINVYEEIPKPTHQLSLLKTTNALAFVMAGIYQKQHRLDDVLLLNQNGFLCESTVSNVFVVYQNTIYTPALSEGCVDGVMRKVVMKIAKKHQVEIVEAQINPKILNEAEEVFLTNAIRGVRWVMGYGRKRYFNKMSRQISDWLNESVG